MPRTAKKTSAPEIFNQEARPPLLKKFSFKAAVAEFYREYPEHEGNVFFVDARDGSYLYTHKITTDLKEFFDRNEKIQEALTKAQRTKTSETLFLHRTLSRKKKKALSPQVAVEYVVLTLYLEDDLSILLPSKHDPDEHKFISFDHEVAHAIVPLAADSSKTVASETAADIYSAIMHYRRFGIKSKTIEIFSQMRAFHFFSNKDWVHFTSPALEFIANNKSALKLDKISSSEVILMANHCGEALVVEERALRSLRRYFNGLLKGMCALLAEGEMSLRYIANKVFSSRLDLRRRYGGVVLGTFLDNNISLFIEREELGAVASDDIRTKVELQGKYWEEVRKKLDAMGVPSLTAEFKTVLQHRKPVNNPVNNNTAIKEASPRIQNSQK